ncbi:DUF3604 domain-containing protein [bacterium]|nr:DUF3604 domain-containing protein [bacterium]
MKRKQKGGTTTYFEPPDRKAYVRPVVGGAYAPRRIEICSAPGENWMAWIHRKDERDVPVVVRDSDGGLQEVEIDADVFSEPVLLPLNDEGPPLVIFGAGGRRMDQRFYEIRVYGNEAGEWACSHSMGTECVAVCDMDGIILPETLEDGTQAILVYSGLLKGAQGLRLFQRRLRRGRWSKEERLPFGRSGSLARPRLAVSAQGEIVLVADAYEDGSFDIVWRDLRATDIDWQRVTSGPDWDLFPSVTADARGRVWLSWLHQTPVRRESVMGTRQEARVARLSSGKWRRVRDGAKDAAADLSLGLLPIECYLGYDGLRRYPRMLATDDGAVWLTWEQQKDETPDWDHVVHGFFCARRFDGRRWEEPRQWLEHGTCFAFDPRTTHPADGVAVAAKMGHRASGADFEIFKILAEKADAWSPRLDTQWRGWKSQNLPAFDSDKGKLEVQSDTAPEVPLHLHWGDLHCHSRFSPDAEGEPDELFHFARDLARLDFVAVVDNDFYPNKVLLDSECHVLSAMADQFTCPGEFAAFAGYEWTFHRPGAAQRYNHRIVLFPKGEKEAARRNETDGATQKAFRAWQDRTGYFNFPHHADWSLLNAAGEWAVEVTAAWGLYIREARTIPRALNRGARFGFLGNSDSHRFMPGLSGALTGVYAENLTREGIIDAIRRRRCFATTGNRTGVAFWVEDAFMGGEAVCSGAPMVRWKVTPHEEVETVTVIRDGKPCCQSGAVEGEWQDRKVRTGSHWYMIEVKEKGKQEMYPHNVAMAWGKYAWSSPVWVQVSI